jgi:hypothetical protein
MELNEFNQTIARIHDAFPRKTYSHDQMMRLYAEVRALTRRNFEDAVISLLDNSSFHPTVNAIRQACYPYLQKMRAETRAFTECGKCYGNGQMDVQTSDFKRMAIACPYCAAADQRGLSRTAFPRMSIAEFESKDKLTKDLNTLKKRSHVNPADLIASLTNNLMSAKLKEKPTGSTDGDQS